jgi:uncharacterized Zn finger protein (UPF0148 family)
MEQMNQGQIKKYLRQLRERRDQYLYYLGQLAYKAGDAGQLQEPEMVEVYNTLKDIEAQVGQCENSLAQIKAAKGAARQGPRCPYCGTPVIKGAVFCAACGQPVVQQPVWQGPAMPQQPAKACPSCGAPADESTVFCSNCGARVDAEAASGPAGAEPETSACPSCGALCGDVKFCPECGAKIKE